GRPSWTWRGGADRANASVDWRRSAWKLKDSARAPPLGRDSDSALSDRQRLDHRRELRGLAFLRAPPPPKVCLPRLLLPLLGQPLLSCARVLGRELDHLDVPARELGSHPRQYALPGGLREERRGCVRLDSLSRLLLRRRVRRHADADVRDSCVRDRRGSARA